MFSSQNPLAQIQTAVLSFWMWFLSKVLKLLPALLDEAHIFELYKEHISNDKKLWRQAAIFNKLNGSSLLLLQ